MKDILNKGKCTKVLSRCFHYSAIASIFCPFFQFKPMSVLFGMDMFGYKPNDSDILAPDSDSD